MATAKAKKHSPDKSKSNVATRLKETTVIDTSNINIIYGDIDTSNTKILVLSLLNNPTKSLSYLESFINELTNKLPKTKFSFFTNNNTKLNDLAISFLGQEHKNLYIIKHIDETINIENRLIKFAEYRNLNFDKAIEFWGSDFDYVIIFDSDINSKIPIDNLLKGLTITNEWSCISSNHTYNDCDIYYDELSLRLLNENYDITTIHPDFEKFYGKAFDWLNRYMVFRDWMKVRCAFGGLSVYKMNELIDIKNKYGQLYDLSSYPKHTVEHISLNDKLSQAILINPSVKYSNRSSIGHMVNTTAFVPRDAGFFSVFNFYIGTLTQDLKSYPLWNKEELLKKHTENKHFAYWTDNSNCWFDYFEPVKFTPDDDNHISDNYLTFARYSGEHAPDEFKIPAITKKLLTGDPENFKIWREKTHFYFQQFIKFKKEILQETDKIWHDNFKDVANVIGVHYRHPSHFIESGKVYLEDYFDRIDKILINHPKSKIFLASDSQFGIYSFVERYKDKIVYIEDIDRLTMSEFLHWVFGLADGPADIVGFINGKGYELHHKRVGIADNKKMTIDLLKEVICLSKCNQLINSVSNIPLAISYINPKIEIITI